MVDFATPYLLPSGEPTMSDQRDMRAVFLREAEQLRDQIIDLTLRLARERTVNYREEDFPGAGPDGMSSPGEEGKICALLGRELDTIGIAWKTYAKVRGRDSLLAQVGQRKPQYHRLLVLLHTDTVPAGSDHAWRFAPYEPFAKDGKIYGRGVLDDKGPLAASFAALRILKRHEADLPGAFQFGAVADEEVDIGVGLPHLIASGVFDCTDAIIPDIAGNMKEINVAEKGRVLLKVRARGVQAHAMDPSKGVNAIHAMARFLLALEACRLEHRPHPLLGGPTINTGLIRGGAAPNAVAGECEATLDIRYVPGQTGAAIRSTIQGLADGVVLPGSSFDVEVVDEALPCEVAPDAPIVRKILAHAPDAQVVGSGGGTFAKGLVLAGVDAVGWSCGDEATYHQPNEEIEVDQLVTFAGRLAALAFDLASERLPG
jgi:succinyl-diaminopimelate desuccinylase